jgi:hypothetical protein
MTSQNSITDISNNITNTSPIIDDSEHMKDLCLTNLKILSQIKDGDKLYCLNGIFSIDSPTYTQGIFRWYYSESRNITLKNLDDLLSNLFKTIDHIYKKELKTEQSLENNYYSRMLSKSNNIFNEEGKNELLTFLTEMKNCINGLNNLKLTYKADISTVSSIDVIIEKINVRIKKISNILSIDKTN